MNHELTRFPWSLQGSAICFKQSKDAYEFPLVYLSDELFSEGKITSDGIDISNLILATGDMFEALRKLANFLSENKIHVGTDGSLNEDLDNLVGLSKAALNKAQGK
jgi:hypothetical protein